MEKATGRMRRYPYSHFTQKLHGVEKGSFVRMFRDGSIRMIANGTNRLCVINFMSEKMQSYDLDSLIDLMGGIRGDYSDASFLEMSDGTWWMMYNKGLMQFSSTNTSLHWYPCNGSSMSLVQRQEAGRDLYYT
jgi:hypothetical protein